MERQLEYNERSFQNKLGEFIKKNFYDIAIFIACIVFMFQGVADVKKSGATVVEILGKGFITFIFSFALARFFEGKGFVQGEESEKYKKALELYRVSADKAGKSIEKLDEWCERHSEEIYRNKITTMLYPLGISFEQFVKNDFKEDSFTQQQKRRLWVIRRTKMHRLTTQELMSGDLGAESEENYAKKTKKRYKKNSKIGDVGTKIIITLVLGYFVLPPIYEWNWSALIWSAFTTVIILVFSILKYFNAYSFVCDDLCSALGYKTNKLNQFFKEKGEIENDYVKENEKPVCSTRRKNDYERPECTIAIPIGVEAI